MPSTPYVASPQSFQPAVMEGYEDGESDAQEQWTSWLENQRLDVPAEYRQAGQQYVGGEPAGPRRLSILIAFCLIFNIHYFSLTSNCHPYSMKQPLTDGRYFSNRSEEHTSELQSLMRISY